MKLIQRYESVIRKSWSRSKRLNLFEYIVKVFDGSLENTDSEPESPSASQEMSQEMLHMYMDKESVPKQSMKRQLSEDYKANTP